MDRGHPVQARHQLVRHGGLASGGPSDRLVLRAGVCGGRVARVGGVEEGGDGVDDDDGGSFWGEGWSRVEDQREEMGQGRCRVVMESVVDSVDRCLSSFIRARRRGTGRSMF